jgi:saccharopine dehydrogenase-like NADP-dependent oxidoreductase
VDVRGVRVAPRDVFSALVFPQWAFDEDEPDLTVMQIEAEGEVDGIATRWRWELDDRYDPETGIRSMSRTTGFPATIFANLIVEGALRRPGVNAPEVLGADPTLVDRVLEEHALRGVFYTFSEERL